MVKTSPPSAGDGSLIPGQGAKILHASWLKNQNIKPKQYCNTFNKDFKKWTIKKPLKKIRNKRVFRFFKKQINKIK